MLLFCFTFDVYFLCSDVHKPSHLVVDSHNPITPRWAEGGGALWDDPVRTAFAVNKVRRVDAVPTVGHPPSDALVPG